MTFARSPVIPKITRTSAGLDVSVWVATCALSSRSSLLVLVDGDSSHALVRQLAACPVDDRLRTILVRRHECQVDGAPGELRLVALHRLSAEHLHDLVVAPDRRHRALVPVLERLRGLARD